MPLRTRFALLLVAALTAMTLSVAVDVADGGAVHRGDPDASFAIRAMRADASAPRLSDERRDGATERTPKHRLVLFAVLTAVLCAVATTWRAAVRNSRPRRRVASLWSPESGRSPPPPFSLSIT